MKRMRWRKCLFKSYQLHDENKVYLELWIFDNKIYINEYASWNTPWTMTTYDKLSVREAKKLAVTEYKKHLESLIKRLP